MEFIIECILELLLEGSIEVLPNKKISKWIRYPLAIFVILFFLVAIGLFFLVGILAMKDDALPFGIIFIAIGIVLLVGYIHNFIEVKNKMNNNLGDKDEE